MTEGIVHVPLKTEATTYPLTGRRNQEQKQWSRIQGEAMEHREKITNQGLISTEQRNYKYILKKHVYGLNNKAKAKFVPYLILKGKYTIKNMTWTKNKLVLDR